MNRLSEAPNTKTEVSISELVSHPINTRVYGLLETDADFLESIKRWGIIDPIVYQSLSFDGVKFQNVIVSGHRRFLAAKTFRFETVPVRLLGEPIKDREDLLAVERLVIEANRQRVKTQEQIGREYAELLRIESEAASLRQKAGKDLRENLPKGRARDKAAATFGISGKTAEKISKVVEAADNGNSTAVSLLEQLNKNTVSPHAAYQEVFPSASSIKCDRYPASAALTSSSAGRMALMVPPDRQRKGVFEDDDGIEHDRVNLCDPEHVYLPDASTRYTTRDGYSRKRVMEVLRRHRWADRHVGAVYEIMCRGGRAVEIARRDKLSIKTIRGHCSIVLHELRDSGVPKYIPKDLSRSESVEVGTI